MGKAGRFACIVVPMCLTLASLICILLVELGGTNKGMAGLNDLYFLKIDPSDLSDGKVKLPDIIPNTKIDDNLIGKALDEIFKNGTNEIDIDKVYTVGLWNYCWGQNEGGKYVVDDCKKPKAQFWFNPIEAWKLSDFAPVSSYPKQVRDGLGMIRKVSSWMFTAYAIAFFLTLGEFIVGFFAIFSRWGSFATAILSTLSSLFIIGASGAATGLYVALMGTVNGALKEYGVKASLGQSMMTTTWLAVAFSVAAGLFWVISICCCSGRNDKKKVKVEKTPYTYERVASPYLGHSGNAAPMHQQQGGAVPMQNMQYGQKKGAYEPYRNAEV
ncbi:MAG: hypothetical protein M1833_005682 [Piccolia ochrophora]|nr:MAG: hypothetical protein M1833_005682 [Piccolia ochrophora]